MQIIEAPKEPIAGDKPLPTAKVIRPDARKHRSTGSVWADLPTVNPDHAQLAKHRIVGHLGGRRGHHFDMMRSRILHQMRQNNWRRLAITSPSAKCGKSTVALNLALSFGRQTDLRTMLLECDLRRPSIMKLMSLAAPLDLAAALRGDQTIADSACRIGTGLAFSASAQSAPDAAEIFGNASFSKALNTMQAALTPDICLIDTPPMLSCSDTLAISAQVDCVLIVAQADHTTTREIDLCERELATHTNVMGVVLNKCHHIGDGYGYAAYG